MNRREVLKLAGSAVVGGVATAAVAPLSAQALTTTTLMFHKQFSVTADGVTSRIAIPDSARSVLVIANVTALAPPSPQAVVYFTFNVIDAFGSAAPFAGGTIGVTPAYPQSILCFQVTPAVSISWVLYNATSASFNLSVYAR